MLVISSWRLLQCAFNQTLQKARCCQGQDYVSKHATICPQPSSAVQVLPCAQRRPPIVSSSWRPAARPALPQSSSHLLALPHEDLTQSIDRIMWRCIQPFRVTATHQECSHTHAAGEAPYTASPAACRDGRPDLSCILHYVAPICVCLYCCAHHCECSRINDCWHVIFWMHGGFSDHVPLLLCPDRQNSGAVMCSAILVSSATSNIQTQTHMTQTAAFKFNTMLWKTDTGTSQTG